MYNGWALCRISYEEMHLWHNLNHVVRTEQEVTFLGQQVTILMLETDTNIENKQIKHILKNLTVDSVVFNTIYSWNL